MGTNEEIIHHKISKKNSTNEHHKAYSLIIISDLTNSITITIR